MGILADRSARRKTAVLLIGLQLAGPLASSTWAAPAQPPVSSRDYKKIESQIPQAPSAPPSMEQPNGNPQSFRCDRLFIYEGKTLPCDSFVRRDAENLRPLLKDTPAALAELNDYQRTRRNIRTLAYVSSAGLALALAGLFVSKPAFSEGEIRPGGYMILGGLGLSASSFIYSLSLTRSNEDHLTRAVDFHNQAHPDRPIVLQFTAKIGI